MRPSNDFSHSSSGITASKKANEGQLEFIFDLIREQIQAGRMQDHEALAKMFYDVMNHPSVERAHERIPAGSENAESTF